MTTPLYAVGERMLIKSVSYPSYNGPCVVTEIYPDTRGCVNFAHTHKHSYETSIRSPDNLHWAECSLNKLPPEEGSGCTTLEKSLLDLKIPVTIEGG